MRFKDLLAEQQLFIITKNIFNGMMEISIAVYTDLYIHLCTYQILMSAHM